MLSCSWTDLRARKNLQQNLFSDLSRIMLAMSQIALPKIGSFTIDHNGYLQLANGPLTLKLHDLENEGISVDMPRDQTFASVDSYANGLLSCHDNRLRFQPNAVNNASDCVSQMTALALMRTGCTVTSAMRSLVFLFPYRLGLSCSLHPGILLLQPLQEQLPPSHTFFAWRHLQMTTTDSVFWRGWGYTYG